MDVAAKADDVAEAEAVEEFEQLDVAEAASAMPQAPASNGCSQPKRPGLKWVATYPQLDTVPNPPLKES
jgi:hypothetical protein